METKILSVFRQLGRCEVSTEEKEKKVIEKVNFSVIFIEVNLPCPVAKEYRSMQLENICKGTYREEIGMFLSLTRKETTCSFL